MAVEQQTTNEVQSWASYLWEATKQVIPSTLYGYTVGNVPGAVVAASTSLGIFFLHQDSIKNHSAIQSSFPAKMVYHTSSILLPVVAARNLPSTPDCLISKALIGERSCKGVDSFSAITSYVAFKSVDSTSIKSESLKVIVATGASCAAIALSKFFEVMAYELANTPIVIRLGTG